MLTALLAIGAAALLIGASAVAFALGRGAAPLRMSRDVWLLSLLIGIVVGGGVGLFLGVPLVLVAEEDFTPAEELKAQTDARTAALAFMAGVGAAVATLFAGRTYFLTRRGQLSERQANATAQLYSTQEGVRMAGVAALERIAIESPRDHARLMELLAHFLRTAKREEPTPPADVRAACRALVERRVAADRGLRLDLTGADLRSADLGGVGLRGAILRRARLDNADLKDADLRDADLSEVAAPSVVLRRARIAGALFDGASLTAASLDGANAAGASFRRAELDSARFEGAQLRGADFYGAFGPFADLSGADARGANLAGAQFPGASLRAADLTGAGLSGADLSGADTTGAQGITAPAASPTPDAAE